MGVRVGHILGHIGSKWDKFGNFEDFAKPKCTETDLKIQNFGTFGQNVLEPKSPRLIQCEINLTQLLANPESPEAAH